MFSFSQGKIYGWIWMRPRKTTNTALHLNRLTVCLTEATQRSLRTKLAQLPNWQLMFLSWNERAVCICICNANVSGKCGFSARGLKVVSRKSKPLLPQSVGNIRLKIHICIYCSYQYIYLFHCF